MGMHPSLRRARDAGGHHAPGVTVGEDAMLCVDSDGKLFNRADGLGMPPTVHAWSIRGEKNEHN
jgi:hypothetical protein